MAAPVNALGVYIRTHGELLPDAPPVELPKGIEVIKCSLAGYGCPSFPGTSKVAYEKEQAIELAGEAYNFPNKQTYINDVSRRKNNKTNQLVQLEDIKDSCQVFRSRDGVTTLMEKKMMWTTTLTFNTVTFAIGNETIELFACNYEDLTNFFFSRFNVLDDEIIAQCANVIQQFIETRDKMNESKIVGKEIRTSDMMKLIDILCRYVGINSVRILDESCAIWRVDKQIQPKESLRTLPPTHGYGRKKRRTKRRRVK